MPTEQEWADLAQAAQNKEEYQDLIGLWADWAEEEGLGYHVGLRRMGTLGKRPLREVSLFGIFRKRRFVYSWKIRDNGWADDYYVIRPDPRLAPWAEKEPDRWFRSFLEAMVDQARRMSRE